MGPSDLEGWDKVGALILSTHTLHILHYPSHQVDPPTFPSKQPQPFHSYSFEDK